MNAPPAATRDGAFLAHVLADALKLGLPDPDYITMSPPTAGGRFTSAVSFQFNDRRGEDPLPRLHAWADRFGVDVRVSVGTVHPASTWHKFEFVHAGVRFDAYAEIVDPEPCGAVAPQSGVTCARPAGHDGFHESGHTPAIVWERPEVAWAKEDAAAAVLAASIASGQPLAIACAACGQPRHAHHHGEIGSIPGLCDAYDPGELEAADIAYDRTHPDPYAASISMRIAGGAS